MQQHVEDFFLQGCQNLKYCNQNPLYTPDAICMILEKIPSTSKKDGTKACKISGESRWENQV